MSGKSSVDLEAHRDPSVSEIRAKLPAGSRRRSVAVGIFLFVFSAALLGGAYALMLLSPNWPLRIALATLTGLLTGMMYVIGHDACHGGLTPSNIANKILGRLALTAGWHPYAGWALYHNGFHHGFTNLRGYDTAYPPLTKDEFDALPRLNQRLERIYRSPLGIGLFYFANWWTKLMFPKADYRRHMASQSQFELDRLGVLALFACDIAVLTHTALRMAPLPVVGTAGTIAAMITVGFVLPFSIWMWVAGFVTFQHHTHPDVPWFGSRDEWSFYRGHLRGSVHVYFPRPIELLFGNINEHHAHHVDVKIPLYKLPNCQKTLEDRYENELTVQVWNLGAYARTMHCCKLYDYDNRRWLDFEGNPTTEPVPWLPPRAAQVPAA